MVVHLPLFRIVFPPNVILLIQPLVNVANFDIIPVDLFYPYIFDFGDSEPYNQQFQFTGYESGYLPENCGTTFTLTHIAIFGLTITYVLKKSIKFAAKLQTEESKKVNRLIFIMYRPYFKLRYWLSWKVLIRTSLEVYLEMFLSTIVILVKFPWSDDHLDRLNCVYALIYGFLLAFFPIFLAYF